MLRRNGPVVKSVESVLRLEGSLWGERFAYSKHFYTLGSNFGTVDVKTFSST